MEIETGAESEEVLHIIDQPQEFVIWFSVKFQFIIIIMC